MNSMQQSVNNVRFGNLKLNEVAEGTGNLAQKQQALHPVLKTNAESVNILSQAFGKLKTHLEWIASGIFIGGLLAIPIAIGSVTKMMLMAYLNTYAPYTGDNALIKKYNELMKKEKDSIKKTYSSINREDARKYMETYYNKFNTPYYPDMTKMDGDCTNYASQVLRAGGVDMDELGGWYMKPKQWPPTYTQPKNASEFDQSWETGTLGKSAWISASYFNYYWRIRDNGTDRLSPQQVIDSRQNLYDTLYTGDIIQILEPAAVGYTAVHTMVVYNYNHSTKDLILSGHSSSTITTSLQDLAKRKLYDNVLFEIIHIN